MPAGHFERAVKTGSDPKAVEQVWFQLETVYRRLNRMDEARAMSMYQQLKDADVQKYQKGS